MEELLGSEMGCFSRELSDGEGGQVQEAWGRLACPGPQGPKWSG